MIQPLWRTVWRFLKKLKIELPYDPATPLVGIYPEKTIIQKDNKPNPKIGKRPKQTFLQRHTDGQEAHEKLLNITNY